VAHWSEEAARSYLPRLRVLLASLQRAGGAASVARANGHATVPGADSPGGDAPGSRDDRAAALPAGVAVEDLVPVAEAVAELEAEGVVVRDVARGIVDFPSRHPAGGEVHLCWRLGEDDLAWWHLPDAGFAGRRPLPLPPDLPGTPEG
jgi:Uncharacterized conserved protein (DUF2203)